MSFISKHPCYLKVMIVLTSLWVCLFFIHGFPIYILDEAKNAEAAREMFVNQTFILPSFNDSLRTDKPPLHYFFMMLSYKIFGVNAFSARFFSAVFGALTLSGTFYFLCRLANKKVALLSWFVLLSAVFFVQLFHQAVPDPYLIFFVSMALFCFIDYYKHRQRIFLLLFYVFLGLGILSKGPVAVVLPAGIVGVFLLFQKELFTKKLFGYYPVVGLIIVLSIAAPWFIKVHQATNGAFTQGFFIDHNINRFNSEMEGHGGIFLLTWAFVILGLLPFSVFIIQSFTQVYKNRTHDFILFTLITTVFFILFFSISSTKLPNYTMPCYPFLAFMIANYIYKLHIEELQMKWYRYSLIALIIISLLLPVGAYIAFQVERELQSINYLSLWLLIAPLGSGLAYYFFLNKNLKNSILSIGGTWIVLGMVIFSVIYPQLLIKNPVYESLKIMPKDAEVIAYKRFDAAYPFNYQRTFQVVDDKNELLEHLNQYPKTYIISNHRQVEEELNGLGLELILSQKALFENHSTFVYRVGEGLK